MRIYRPEKVISAEGIAMYSYLKKGSGCESPCFLGIPKTKVLSFFSSIKVEKLMNLTDSDIIELSLK